VARGIRALTILTLAGVAFALLWFIFAFGQDRFFTKDEYQWGHLVWLVQQGQVPYLDFYEHHLPLGYLAHAQVVPEDGSFSQRALFLRKIAFAWILAAVAMLGIATYVTRKNLFSALLTAILSLSFGFSLMSAIEFRADNWSGFLTLICLALLEINRRLRRRSIAVTSGVLFALAVFMTQKIVLLGGLALGAMMLPRALDALGIRRDPLDPPLVPNAVAFCTAGTAVAALLLVAGAHAGILERGFEINLSEALAHERLYPETIKVFAYALPFLHETLLTTTPILLFAAVSLRHGLAGFWTLPLLLGLAGSLLVKAQYPYNYVLVCFLIVVAAVRGFTDLVERVRPEAPIGRALVPLLYLLPLLLVPGQLDFVRNRTGNEHQLRLLEMVERYTDEDDVVIDDSGSALFRPHRGYYWYHDKAHVQLFSDYFTGTFVDDLRNTRAKFWIRGSRVGQLPKSAQAHLESHYLPFFGSLYVLGFTTLPGSATQARVMEADILRTGHYTLSVEPGSASRWADKEPWRSDLRVDGRPIEGSSIHLEEGRVRLQIEPGAPAFRFTYLPPLAFGTGRGMNLYHDPGFEYRRR